VEIAEADAGQPSPKVAWREAIWAIKGLGNEPLPLFATALTGLAEGQAVGQGGGEGAVLMRFDRSCTVRRDRWFEPLRSDPSVLRHVQYRAATILR
jgi:hypothetical protein